MNKGFSDNSNLDNDNAEEIKNPKTGLAKILAEKKFTYTLPAVSYTHLTLPTKA